MSSNYWFLSCYIGERTLSDTVNQYVVPGVVHTTQTVGMRQPVENYQEVLGASRKKLFDARSKRPRPHLDDKVV